MKESGGRIMLPSQVLRKDKKEHFNRTCIIEVHIKRQSRYSINSFYGITRKSFGSLASRPPNDNSFLFFLCNYSLNTFRDYFCYRCCCYCSRKTTILEIVEENYPEDWFVDDCKLGFGLNFP